MISNAISSPAPNHPPNEQSNFVPQENLAAAGARMTPLTALSLRNDIVTIGPVIPEDTGTIFLWLNDVETTNFDFPYRPMDWMAYNEWLSNFAKNPTQVFFAIRLVREPKIIGFIAYTKIHPIHRSAEIGIRIGRELDRGKGYGRHAIGLALKYAWDHLNLKRVQLNVLESNHRAIRAYSTAGFQHEGRLRQAAYINGEWKDVILMGVVRPSDGRSH